MRYIGNENYWYQCKICKKRIDHDQEFEKIITDKNKSFEIEWIHKGCKEQNESNN